MVCNLERVERGPSRLEILGALLHFVFWVSVGTNGDPITSR